MRVERHPGFVVLVGGPVPRGADAITVGRFVSVRRGHEQNAYLLAHEAVHVEQWRRQHAVPFLARYLGAYARWRLRGKGHHGAYRRIPAEIEADWAARRTIGMGVTGPARQPSPS